MGTGRFSQGHEAVEPLFGGKTARGSVFFYHPVWNFVDALLGGEAVLALQAFAAAADGIARLALARNPRLCPFSNRKRGI